MNMSPLTFWNSLFEGQKGCLWVAKLEYDDSTPPNEIPPSWKQEFYPWPERQHEANAFVEKWRDKASVFFGSMLHAEPQGVESSVVETGRVLWADFDNGIPETNPEPTYLFETSPDRGHAYWLLNESVDADIIRRYNKRLAYAYGADKTKWTLTALLRVPGTLNFKYMRGQEPTTKHIGGSGKTYSLDAFAHLPSAPDEDGPVRWGLDGISVLEDDLGIPSCPGCVNDAQQHSKTCRRRHNGQRYGPRHHGRLRQLREKPIAGDRSVDHYTYVISLLEMGLPLAGVMQEGMRSPAGIDKYDRRGELETETFRIIDKAGVAELHAKHIGTYKFCDEVGCAGRPAWQQREPQVVRERKRSPFIRLSEVEEEEIRFLLNRYPVGDLTIVAGEGKVGKSTFLFNSYARAMSGQPQLDGTPPPKEPLRPLILTAEDGLGTNLRPRFRLWGADSLADDVLVYDPRRDEDGFTLTEPEHLQHLADLVQEYDRNLLHIDPMSDWLGMGTDTYNNHKLRRAILPLRQLVRRLNLVAIGLEHFKKDPKETNSVHRIGGSVGLVNAARSVFTVQTDREDQSIRYFAHATATYLRLPTYKYKFVDHPDDKVKRDGGYKHPDVIGLGIHDESSDDILARNNPQRDENGQQRGGPSPKVKEAEDFLLDILSDGPVPSIEVKRQSAEAGISESALEAGKRNLGIKAAKDKSTNGAWSWRLPTATIKIASGKRD